VAPRPGLKREAVVEAAASLADEEGLDGATLAELASRLSYPGDPDFEAAERETFEAVLAVLASYGLRGEDALHAARGLRSVVHGFATLEVSGGFGISLDPDESFDRLLRAFVAGLRHREGQP
jgi:AcrR family transcriptional regulator